MERENDQETTVRLKITNGVSRGISTGTIAHHNLGFELRKRTATSSATTKEMSTAILFAHVGTGRICSDMFPQSPREILRTAAPRPQLFRRR